MSDIYFFISFLDEISLCKQNSPRRDAAFCGVTSGTMLFAYPIKRTTGLYELRWVVVTICNISSVSKKVQAGKDQEKAQSERDSHSKNRGGKKPNQQSGTYTMKHIVSRMSSYFPNRWPLSYLNLIKNMRTYIRRQQHKKKKFF